MSIKPTFQGEMQLAGWSETHTGGCKVTFWLQDSEDLEAFRALTVRKGNTAGQRFMAVLVEVGDDEQPVQQPEPVTERKKPTTGPICLWLVMRCQEPEFRRWLTVRGDFSEPLSEVAASDVVRSWCGVESRRDIDGNPKAEALFRRLIQEPWSKRGVAEPA